MGQSQSSDGQAGQGEGGEKIDYYELLGVGRSTTDEEIKKAYRRKALELHPDRNYGNVEETTKLFADVQSAYEVLSDPQERAWYDSHRDVFIDGSQPGANTDNLFVYNIQMTSADDVLRLMMKHNGKKDYNDSATGFYGGLRDFFAQLAKEEMVACKWEDLDLVEYPDFGLKGDSYEEVVRPFYADWAGFATRKTFSWKDKYRLPDAPDRRVRRLMERENKGLRDDAVREFNDAVRSLIAFVRKRDPRYQDNQKTDEERQRALREAAAMQSARSRATRQARLQELDAQTVPDWTKSAPNNDNEGGFSSDEQSEQHEIECVACSKDFKSEAQFAAHERSKKHIKRLKDLRREMKADDQKISNRDILHTPDVNVKDELPEAVPMDEEGDFATNVTESDNSTASEPEPEPKPETNSSSIPSEARHSDKGPSSEDEDSDYAPRSGVEDRLGNGTPEGISARLKAATVEDSSDVSTNESSTGPKLGKAKQKKAKKALKRDTLESSADKFSCAVCKAAFPSKTKLFSHIKDKGHAAPVSVSGKLARGGKR